MTSVGIFLPSDNSLHQNVLLAFAEGVRNVLHPPMLYSVDDYHEVDVAVVFGIGKRGVPCSFARGNVIRQQLLAGKEVIVLERGFVKRDEYWMVGRNGNINGRAQFNNLAMAPNRWEALDVMLQPKRTVGKHIVVCGQVPSDASVQHIDIIHWCQKVCTDLRRITKRPIIFRAHPMAKNRTPAMIGVKNSHKETLIEDLYGAHACVTYNSNAAVEAVIAGIPAFSFDEGSMAYDITSHDLRMIDKPYFPDERARLSWAYNLAFTQWTTAEMRTGAPWLHIMSGLTLTEDAL